MSYLDTLDACVDECGITYDELSITDCIIQIQKDHGPDKCQVPKECIIVKSDMFRRLLVSLTRLIRFLYHSRRYYGNKYDSHIIVTVGHINIAEFGMTEEDISCVKFPGDGTWQLGFPDTLAVYLKIMKRICSHWPNESELANDDVLSPYSKFCSDTQPWTSMLVAFLQKYGMDIPPTVPVDGYGSFIPSDARSKNKLDNWVSCHVTNDKAYTLRNMALKRTQSGERLTRPHTMICPSRVCLEQNTTS